MRFTTYYVGVAYDELEVIYELSNLGVDEREYEIYTEGDFIVVESNKRSVYNAMRNLYDYGYEVFIDGKSIDKYDNHGMGY